MPTIKIAINGLKVVVEILFCKLYFWIILSENFIGFKQNMTIPEVSIKMVVYFCILFEAGPKFTYLFLQQLNGGTRRLALNFRFICLLVCPQRAQCVYILF